MLNDSKNKENNAMKKSDYEKIVFSTAQQTLTIYNDIDNSHNQDLHRVEYKHLQKKYGQNFFISTTDYERTKTAKTFTQAKSTTASMFYPSELIKY